MRFIQDIQNYFQPTNFRWAAVPELHDCQVKCHQKRRKGQNKKRNKAKHSPAFFRCATKHECQKNWHIHLVISNFFPAYCRHAKCGLDLGRGCPDCSFILSHFWPWGLVFVKRIRDLSHRGQRVKTPEAIVRYLAKYLVKNFRLRKDPEKAQEPPLKNSYSPIDFIKLCLATSSRATVKNNPAWKSCQDSPNENITGCIYDHNNHTEPIIRLEFEFNGAKAYDRFQQKILPALKFLKLPNFTKFADYQPDPSAYAKFGELAVLPWNKEIGHLAPYNCGTEGYWDDSEWRLTVPPVELYNWVYLPEIRAEINGERWKYAGLSYEQAAKRYADY